MSKWPLKHTDLNLNPGSATNQLCGLVCGFVSLVSVPTLVPEWSVFMNMRNINLHNLIGPNNTVLIGQNHTSDWSLRNCFDWSVKMRNVQF